MIERYSREGTGIDIVYDDLNGTITIQQQEAAVVVEMVPQLTLQDLQTTRIKIFNYGRSRRRSGMGKRKCKLQRDCWNVQRLLRLFQQVVTTIC